MTSKICELRYSINYSKLKYKHLLIIFTLTIMKRNRTQDSRDIHVPIVSITNRMFVSNSSVNQRLYISITNAIKFYYKQFNLFVINAIILFYFFHDLFNNSFITSMTFHNLIFYITSVWLFNFLCFLIFLSNIKRYASTA